MSFNAQTTIIKVIENDVQIKILSINIGISTSTSIAKGRKPH